VPDPHPGPLHGEGERAAAATRRRARSTSNVERNARARFSRYGGRMTPRSVMNAAMMISRRHIERRVVDWIPSGAVCRRIRGVNLAPIPVLDRDLLPRGDRKNRTCSMGRRHKTAGDGSARTATPYVPILSPCRVGRDAVGPTTTDCTKTFAHHLGRHRIADSASFQCLAGAVPRR